MRAWIRGERGKGEHTTGPDRPEGVRATSMGRWRWKGSLTRHPKESEGRARAVSAAEHRRSGGEGDGTARRSITVVDYSWRMPHSIRRATTSGEREFRSGSLSNSLVRSR